MHQSSSYPKRPPAVGAVTRWLVPIPVIIRITAWKKWPLWYVLITTLLQTAIGQAGRLIAASAVLYYLFSAAWGVEIEIWVFALVLGVSCIAIILRGSYRAVETLTKALAGILLLATIAVYVVKPARALASIPV